MRDISRQCKCYLFLQLGGSGITLPPPASMLANKVVQAFVKGDLKEATNYNFNSQAIRIVGWAMALPQP
jgi:hypothetical protein